MNNIMYMEPNELFEYYKKDTYITYKFYDDRGRRLSIFAIPTYSEYSGDKPDILAITVFVCNKGDVFSKKKAKELYNRCFTEDRKELEKEGIKPFTFFTKITDDKPKFTFMAWCKEKYRKEHTENFLLRGMIKKITAKEELVGKLKRKGGPHSTIEIVTLW